MESLISAMEGIVEDLYGHVHRVASVAVEIGRVLGLEREDLDRLGSVGVLHDVGKIHVDPAILAKPGPLVGEELASIRRHPQLGFAMTVDRFDRKVADAILYHHERWDGGGYPFGLRGTEIPALARIVLVADAFDAITSTRAYQPALPAEYAIAEITRNRGTQFCPNAVAAFLDVIAHDRLPLPTALSFGIAAR
jgi:HD-GYP domain-containing protein (c-di-GMP phosphodiesterase class II)